MMCILRMALGMACCVKFYNPIMLVYIDDRLFKNNMKIKVLRFNRWYIKRKIVEN